MIAVVVAVVVVVVKLVTAASSNVLEVGAAARKVVIWGAELRLLMVSEVEMGFSEGAVVEVVVRMRISGMEVLR